ncbi:MAG TPA: magnesium transporter [Thermoanaerobaculia bacterium]|nr:magnesium transporter [Thermoanaerobaculia bacterium]
MEALESPPRNGPDGPGGSRPDELLAGALRKFVRRGTRADIVRLLSKLRPEDVAVLIGGLSAAERLHVFQILAEEYPDSAGDVLTELEAPQRLELLEELPPEGIAEILESAAVDDAVYVIEWLPEDLKQKVLEIVDLHHLSELKSQLTYEDGTAGRIMTTEYLVLPETARVRQAIAAIQEKRDVEMIFYLYTVDSDKRLLGVTSLRRLLFSHPEQRLGEILQRDVLRVRTDTDQEEVAQLAARYDLLAVPVVDADDRLVGIVTLDDIVDVVEEEANEDILKIAGTSEDELIYEEKSLRVARIRLPWLLVNLCGGILTGVLLETFQVGFKQALFLLSFVPVVMGMGGNSGTQTSTITVRGLATGRIDLNRSRVLRYLWQQLKVGVILGCATGTVAGLAALVLQRNPAYSVVVGLAMLLAILVSSFNGVLIPLLFEKLGIDPAVAAGPLVTTSNDITGILIYFGLASLLIDVLIR